GPGDDRLCALDGAGRGGRGGADAWGSGAGERGPASGRGNPDRRQHLETDPRGGAECRVERDGAGGGVGRSALSADPLTLPRLTRGPLPLLWGEVSICRLAFVFIH